MNRIAFLTKIRVGFQNRTIFTQLRQEEIHQPVIRCRDRPFLAGGDSEKLPEYLPREINKYFCGLKVDEEPHGKNNLKDIGKEFRRYIDENLNQYSAFLLKGGVPSASMEDFNKLISAIDYKPYFYDAGTAARSTVGDFLYTASDEPPEISIEPHNEMSYLETQPTKIMFCCVLAADDGGDSPVVFNRDIKRDLNPKVYDKFKERKIRYIRNLSHENNSPYLTWQETFKTKKEEKAESVMRRENIKWDWQPNGDLSLWNVGDAVIKHPRTNEEIFFNQATASHCSYYKTMPMYVDKQDMEPSKYHLHTCYGDGEEFEEESVEEIRSALWSNAMALKLMPGDVLILDNLLALHSRMSYQGGERKILVNLSW